MLKGRSMSRRKRNCFHILQAFPSTPIYYIFRMRSLRTDASLVSRYEFRRIKWTCSISAFALSMRSVIQILLSRRLKKKHLKKFLKILAHFCLNFQIRKKFQTIYLDHQSRFSENLEEYVWQLRQIVCKKIADILFKVWNFGSFFFFFLGISRKFRTVVTFEAPWIFSVKDQTR